MQEKSLIKKNILQYLEIKGITRYKFYQETGITRGILDQENGMSEENTAKFLACFSEISAEWLITGKGNMFKEKQIENATVVSEPETAYQATDKYKDELISQLKSENERLILENTKKQQLIDSLLAGNIVVDKNKTA